MESDIVEKLRRKCVQEPWAYANWLGAPYKIILINPDGEEAAAEIERLRAERLSNIGILLSIIEYLEECFEEQYEDDNGELAGIRAEYEADIAKAEGK